MFGPLGVPELIFILVLALLIFGPKRLPEVGRTIGRGMAEFRKASNEIKRTINTELALEEDTRPAVRPPRVEPPAMTSPRAAAVRSRELPEEAAAEPSGEAVEAGGTADIADIADIGDIGDIPDHPLEPR